MEGHKVKKQGYADYFDEWSQRDLTDMLHRDRNHPSVVLWSVGNEIPEQTHPQGPQTLQALVDILHAADPTRPVTVGCDNIAAEPRATPEEFLARLDVVGYNYVDRWRERREQFYSPDRHDFPQRRFIGTESEAMGGVRGMYRPGDDAPVFGERTVNRRIAVEQLQKFVQTYDYVSGDFMWTGIDYLGEARWPAKLAASGVLDTCGYPKDGYYFYQSLWTDKPVLHLFPHWNWSGSDGRGHHGDVLHQLRHRGTLPGRQKLRREGLRLPAPRHGGQVRQLPAARQGTADHGRPASGLGCGVCARSAQGGRNPRHRRCGDLRSCAPPAPRRRSGSALIAADCGPMAAMWHTCRWKSPMPPACACPPPTTSIAFELSGSGKLSAWTMASPTATSPIRP